MSLSRVTYTSDGVTANYNITFGYIAASHVKVTVYDADGVSNPTDVAFSFNSQTSIHLSAVPSSGKKIKIYNSISATVPYVDFTNGAELNEKSLDDNSLALLMVAQRAIDDSAEALEATGKVEVSAGAAQASALAASTSASDAATQVTLANTARTGAETARTGAETAQAAAQAIVTSLTIPPEGYASRGANTFTGIQIMSGAAFNEAKGGTKASAATVNLDTATGNFVHISGTTAITAVTLTAGYSRSVVFDGVLVLTNSANLILPTGANITTAVGDTAVFRGEGAGVVRVTEYQRADGKALTQGTQPGLILLSTITPTVASSISANIFTSAYDNYLIVASGLVPNSADQFKIRFLNAGTPDGNSNYNKVNVNVNGATPQGYIGTNANVAANGKGVHFNLLICNVNDSTGAKRARFEAAHDIDTGGYGSTNYDNLYVGGVVSGVQLFWAGGNTFLASGKVRVYGYQN